MQKASGKVFVLLIVLVGMFFVLKTIPPPPTKTVLDIPVYRNVLEPDENGVVIIKPDQYEAGTLPKVLGLRLEPDIQPVVTCDTCVVEEEKSIHWWRIRVKDRQAEHKVVFSAKPAKAIFSSYEKVLIKQR